MWLIQLSNAFLIKSVFQTLCVMFNLGCMCVSAHLGFLRCEQMGGLSSEVSCIFRRMSEIIKGTGNVFIAVGRAALLLEALRGKFFFLLFQLLGASCLFCNFFFLILTRGHDFKERGRETLIWEKNVHSYPLMRAPTWDWTCNPGVCPDQELNPQPFGLWNDAQTNLSHNAQGMLCNF